MCMYIKYSMEIESSSHIKIKNFPERPAEQSKTPTFVLFCLIIATLNMDSGIVPASLSKIQQEIQITFQEQGAIGALVFLGICIGSLTVTPIFQQFSASATLGNLLITYLLFAILFSFSYDLYLVYICRLGMGFARSFFTIYGPVWVNEFSPPENSTKWLGTLQACSSLGAIGGYTIAGLIIILLGDYLSWRSAIQLEVIILVPLILILKSTDKSNIDIIDASIEENAKTIVSPGDHPTGLQKIIRIDTINISHLANFILQIKQLFSNALFVWVTLALGSLMFVITGIQYWITLYLLQVLKADHLEVIISFSLICSTGPMCGVMFGSTLSDHLGGYKEKNRLTAIQLTLVFSILAAAFAIPIGFVGTFKYVCPMLWIMMFFGGALYPIAIGVNISTQSRENQSAASSISQLIFNLGAYFAPTLSAAVMDLFKDPLYGLKWGIRCILLTSILGIFFMIGAWVVGYKKHQLFEDEERDQVPDLYSNNEFKMEMLRRRLHSYSF
jgi:MFS family permease